MPVGDGMRRLSAMLSFGLCLKNDKFNICRTMIVDLAAKDLL